MNQTKQPTQSEGREQQFEAIIANTIHELQELLLIKGKEYRRDNNPYHNVPSLGLVPSYENNNL